MKYKTTEFKNQTMGLHVHADFPGGIVNDGTYDGTVKSLAYLLNNECYVNIEMGEERIKGHFPLFLMLIYMPSICLSYAPLFPLKSNILFLMFYSINIF